MGDTEQEPLPPLGDVLEFMRVLWALDHGLQRRSKRMAATLGITGPQRLAIRVIGRWPRVSAGKLAEILHLHPSTLTGVLDRLVAAGLVERSRDPDDLRRMLLTLTPKGRRADAATEGTVEAAVRRVLARLPPARVEAARELLRALAGALTPR